MQSPSQLSFLKKLSSYHIPIRHHPLFIPFQSGLLSLCFTEIFPLWLLITFLLRNSLDTFHSHDIWLLSSIDLWPLGLPTFSFFPWQHSLWIFLQPLGYCFFISFLASFSSIQLSNIQVFRGLTSSSSLLKLRSHRHPWLNYLWMLTTPTSSAYMILLSSRSMHPIIYARAQQMSLCDRPDSKYFRLCGAHTVSVPYSLFFFFFAIAYFFLNNALKRKTILSSSGCTETGRKTGNFSL